MDKVKCDYCGKEKEDMSFVIGASTKPDWCMIYGTGKMACPDCYEKAMKEGLGRVEKHIRDWNDGIK